MFSSVLFILFTIAIQKSLNTNDCATLKSLSKILNNRIKSPKIDIGSTLLNDIEKFNDILWDIREAIRDGNKTVMEDIKPIINVTLPSFVKTYETLSKKINKDKRMQLYNAFNWTRELSKSKLSLMLVDLDSQLNTMLLNPQPNQGTKLLTDIDDYTCILWEVRDEIRKLNISVIEDLKLILSTRLPNFIKTYKNTDKVKMYKIFDWTDREEKRLNYLILDSKHLWKTTAKLHDKRLKELM